MPVGKIAYPAFCIRYFPVQVIKYIYKMAELGEQAAPIFQFLTPPVTFFVISITPVPETVDLEHINFAQFFIVHQLFYGLYRWVVPVLLYRKNSFPCGLCSGYHSVTFFYTNSHWFFYYSMPA